MKLKSDILEEYYYTAAKSYIDKMLDCISQEKYHIDYVQLNSLAKDSVIERVYEILSAYHYRYGEAFPIGINPSDKMKLSVKWMETFIEASCNCVFEKTLDKLSDDEYRLLFEYLDDKFFGEWKRIIFNVYDPNLALESIYDINKVGDIRNIKSGKMLTPVKDKKGYMEIRLISGPVTRCYKVHRLVAQTFIENNDIEHNTDVNHIDLHKADNWYRNLEWCTSKYNKNHAMAHDKYYHVYKDDQIKQTCELLANTDLSLTAIAGITGMTLGSVASIYSRKTHIAESKGYKFPVRKGGFKIGSQLGMKNNACIYDDDTVIRVANTLMNPNLSIAEVGRICKVSSALVQKILKKETRADILSGFKFPSKRKDGREASEISNRITDLLKNGMSNELVREIIQNEFKGTDSKWLIHRIAQIKYDMKNN